MAQHTIDKHAVITLLYACRLCAGKLLVRFYGEHSSSWAAPKQLTPWEAGAQEEERLEALRLWGKRANK
jgi:hypothetical protein